MIALRAKNAGWAKELAVYPRLVVQVFPLVRRELAKWTRRARAIPNPELRKQALASLSSKAFHCMGGAVLALMTPRRLKDLVRAIVAIQTVSDYLDNLCDRASGTSTWSGDGSLQAALQGFRICMRLHEAFMCSVDPLRPTVDYYGLYPLEGPPDDGGYLQSLVDAAREVLKRLPAYEGALPEVRELSQLYSELQSIKHLSPEIRDGLMEEWFRVRWQGDLLAEDSRLGLGPMQSSPLLLEAAADGGMAGCEIARCGMAQTSTPFPLKWWEFAAATGSTLGIFALVRAAAQDRTTHCSGALVSAGTRNGPDALMPTGSEGCFNAPAPATTPTWARTLARAYFPSISALHILLDYYIDQDEDRAGGDLNFVSHYSSPAERKEAMSKFVGWAMDEAGSTAEPWLHRAVVRGLLAMYLSDPKVRASALCPEADELANLGRQPTQFLRAACGAIRKGFRF